MKRLRKILLYIIVIAALVFTITSLTGTNYVYKAVIYNFADIDDYKVFDNNTVETGTPQPIPVSVTDNKVPLGDSLRNELVRTKSIAFLALKNDSIVHEEYWDGYNDTSYSGSFSVAKSITGTLVGIALQEGKIKSLDEPVTDFLPEFKEGDKAKITIRNLMTMTSGTNWEESYSSPFSMTTEAYYGFDLYKVATHVKAVKAPGTEWRYKSGDSQLLGLILEKATGESLSQYAGEKLWKPMGAVHSALWSTDKKAGNEKAYCCFNSNARDFSRLGTLYLHKGNWKGKQLIDTTLVNLFTTSLNIKDDSGHITNYYGYDWWVLPERTGVFYARGILGQYIIVIPQKNMVLVRLGEHRGEPLHQSYVEVYNMVDWALKNF